jgi:hypothetical protein
VSAMQRRKGAVAEREVVDVAKAAGFDRAKRTGDAQQRMGDVTGIPGAHVQVKRVETLRIPEWCRELEQACPPHELPVLAFRRSGEPWRAVVPLDELLALLKAVAA